MSCILPPPAIAGHRSPALPPAATPRPVFARRKNFAKPIWRYTEQLLGEHGLDEQDILWLTGKPRGAVIDTGRGVHIECVGPPRTRNHLAVLAHELGHFAMHTLEDHTGRRYLDRARPRHVREYEAEVYALDWFDHAGLPMPLSELAYGVEYIARSVLEDFVAGIEIDAEVAQWCGVEQQLGAKISAADFNKEPTR